MTPKAAELREGDEAPDFSLEDDAGRRVSLGDFKGKTVVLYFYPKDDTPGCTVEACAFRDAQPEFKESGAVILGVSPDGLDSHKKFKAKHRLTFPLLSDPDRKAASAYGAFGKKMMYGRETMGIIRSTFVIGPDGRLEKIFRNVRADGHAEHVLGALATRP